MKTVDLCLLTPGHLCTTPRLVKEAHSLVQAGYTVRVIASDHNPANRPFDEAILAEAKWDCLRVYRPPTLSTRLCERLWNKFWRGLYFSRPHTAHSPQAALFLGARALSARHSAFVSAALKTPARLYLAHTLPGLCAAATAANKNKALLGFDAEDWHSEEQLPNQVRPGELPLRRHLETLLLPRCTHLSAASPLIGAAYAPLAGQEPLTLLNVFPLSEAPATPLPWEQRTRSLYWFSQTIGADRGLEAIVRALSLLPSDWTLHLRGRPDTGYSEALEQLAASLGLSKRIHWLDTAPAEAMVRLASTHRIGLSVEASVPENRARCLTNKLFTCLLGGLPLLLSDTPAHRALLPELGAAAALAKLEDPAALAAAILRLDTTEAAAEAWRLSHTRYNWDLESARFLKHLARTLPKPDAHPSHS